MKRLSKNRAWLEKKCLPKLTGMTLFVGIEKYTKDYHESGLCWTDKLYGR